MSKRLLIALDYPGADNVNLEDQTTFRKLIVWLETNKIQKATPETLTALKNITAKSWPDTLNKYKIELNCPELSTNPEIAYWMCGVAVGVETAKNRELYLTQSVSNLKVTNAPTVVAENPLDHLDFHSKEFGDGINNIARILKIVPHPDPLITLKAIAKLVSKRLHPKVLENPQEYIAHGTPYPYQEVDLGFDLKDPQLNEAAKILRMLYIHDLRDLQTKANELIVAIQNITANPKTDTSLGKVGI